MSYPPPENGPFATRQQAERVFAVYTRAAGRGRSGPPGQQIIATAAEQKASAITDTLEYYAEAGDYDRQLIGRLAGELDVTDIHVICSWFYRIMRDPDVSGYPETPPRPTWLHQAPSGTRRPMHPGIVTPRPDG